MWRDISEFGNDADTGEEHREDTIASITAGKGLAVAHAMSVVIIRTETASAWMMVSECGQGQSICSPVLKPMFVSGKAVLPGRALGKRVDERAGKKVPPGMWMPRTAQESIMLMVQIVPQRNRKRHKNGGGEKTQVAQGSR